MENPRYVHECSTCIFLGLYEEYDLYYCPQSGNPTVIARYSSDGPDYLSSMISCMKPLAEARRLAKERNLRLYEIR